MVGNTFVLIFTVYLISMAAAVALLTIVYITKPRTRGQPKRMSPEFPEHLDAGLLQPGTSLSGPSQTSKGDTKDDPGGEQHEETEKQTVSEAQIREVRTLLSPPAEHRTAEEAEFGGICGRARSGRIGAANQCGGKKQSQRRHIDTDRTVLWCSGRPQRISPAFTVPTRRIYVREA